MPPPRAVSAAIMAARVSPSPVALAVLVPTLNECDNIAPMVAALDAALLGRAYEIVFIDDWSTDGTADAVAAIAMTRSDVRLIRRYGRRGLSSAVVEGALATVAPVIAVIDADMQHDEALLPALVDTVASGQADVAIGSRYIADGSVGDWNAGRARASRIATILSGYLLKQPIGDPMSGFFAVRRDVLIAALPQLSSIGFKILLDLIVSSPVRLRVVELPYSFRNRLAGTSKLDSGIAVDFALMLIDKTIGRFVPARLVLFGAVGVLGLGIHLTALRLFLATGVAFAAAQTAAVVAAMTFNFALNNALTYRDRRLTGVRWLTGLLSFYAVCGIGAIGNVGVGSYVFAAQHSWWLAGIAGAVVGSVWNFAASSVLTWRKR